MIQENDEFIVTKSFFESISTHLASADTKLAKAKFYFFLTISIIYLFNCFIYLFSSLKEFSLSYFLFNLLISLFSFFCYSYLMKKNKKENFKKMYTEHFENMMLQSKIKNEIEKLIQNL